LAGRIFIFGRCSGSGSVEKRLEDKGGGDLIDDLPVLLANVPGLVKDLVGFMRREPLVPQVDWQAREFAQFNRESLRFCGLRARFSGKANRIADDDSRYPESTRQPAEGTKILAAAAFSFERKNRLGRHPELIGDGDTDPPIADVQAH
jgi:hypothetical protein